MAKRKPASIHHLHHMIPAPKPGHGPKFLGLFFIWRLKKSPAHCYSLLDEIKDMGMVSVKPSTVYLILSKLEKAGLVKSEVKQAGRRARRVYSVTLKGRAVFEKLKKEKVKGQLREFLAELLS